MSAVSRSAEDTQQAAGEMSGEEAPLPTDRELCDNSASGNPEQPPGDVARSTTTATTIATNGEPLLVPTESDRPKPEKKVSFGNLNDSANEKEGKPPPRRRLGYHLGRSKPEPPVKQDTDAADEGTPRHEYAFVLCAGVFMAFNSGFVNGSCISGFVVPDRKFAVSSFTQTITMSCLELADGNYNQFRFLLCMFLSFMFGSFISGVLSPNPTPFRIEPMYGPSFLIGAVFLVISSIIAAFEINEDFVFYFAAAANGIQNGVSSIYSENLIRSTGHSGATTDISLFIAQICRGNTKNTGRMLVLVSLLAAFWTGGLIAFWWAKQFQVYALLINAGLFLLVGGSLIAYLVYELGISLREAMMGSWHWKRAISKLHMSLDQSGSFVNSLTEEDKLKQIFDKLDLDNNGELDKHELLLGLREVGVNITERESEMMLQHADIDGNGSLSRDEWLNVARACQKKQRIKDIKAYSKRHRELRESTNSR
ncbi:membrAne [Seminavis robusta]|uniref:MembrAne n=1 Tax=Seminavis robusta TaxID=568900 RepID=A0A9N8H4J3_9STRA|nr:membrAne [Seminavis robusta]|eukprot:Sro50_g029330.1 membrAne (481) ;mRNA; f:148584-150026